MPVYLSRSETEFLTIYGNWDCWHPDLSVITTRNLSTSIKNFVANRINTDCQAMRTRIRYHKIEESLGIENLKVHDIETGETKPYRPPEFDSFLRREQERKLINLLYINSFIVKDMIRKNTIRENFIYAMIDSTNPIAVRMELDRIGLAKKVLFDDKASKYLDVKSLRFKSEDDLVLFKMSQTISNDVRTFTIQDARDIVKESGIIFPQVEELLGLR